MVMPRVLNKKVSGIPAGAVYVGRPARGVKGSKWANPFKIPEDGDRDTVIERFRCEVLPNLDVSELRGKDLVCWCAPEACHADLLLEKANG
jgi:Domain of unknown function (DUF4326)